MFTLHYWFFKILNQILEYMPCYLKHEPLSPFSHFWSKVTPDSFRIVYLGWGRNMYIPFFVLFSKAKTKPKWNEMKRNEMKWNSKCRILLNDVCANKILYVYLYICIYIYCTSDDGDVLFFDGQIDFNFYLSILLHDFKRYINFLYQKFYSLRTGRQGKAGWAHFWKWMIEIWGI